MDKFKAFTTNLADEELEQLKEHLGTGGAAKIIDSELCARGNPMLVCPVCERSVSEERDLVLVFGPPGLRQKARFCGHDCLEYHLSQRKSKSLNSPVDEVRSCR